MGPRPAHGTHNPDIRTYNQAASRLPEGGLCAEKPLVTLPDFFPMLNALKCTKA